MYDRSGVGNGLTLVRAVVCKRMLKPVREHDREDTETECIEDRVLHIIREEETIEVSFIE